uniref:SKP1 component dimerisation domain-containing protein n=1 Tax=viral metagenome TaxID=1070528 RepID=A0A6C0EF74_9ZZZZ
MEEETKVLQIKSSSGLNHSIKYVHAKMSGTIANMLDDIDSTDITIPINNVSDIILKKVIIFCNEKYPNSDIDPTEEQQLEMRTKPLSDFDLEFTRVPLKELFEMILAANFLDLKPMLDVCCKAVAEIIKGKTPNEIKKAFGVEGEFTQEEKEQVLRDNPWLEDPEDTSSNEGGGAAAPLE